MFGRKPPAGPGEAPRQNDRVAPTPLQPSAPRPVAPVQEARPTPPAAPRPVAAATERDEHEIDSGPAPRPIPVPPRPDPARRPAEPVRAEAPAPVPGPQAEVRKLIVGRGIAFSGEISACDQLIVEGTVEAKMPDGQRIEIAETGLFKGTAEVTDADIGGRFEGEITVKGRLSIRATGRVEGVIHYGELAVEAGGTIEGEIRGLTGKNGDRASRPAPKSAATPGPIFETDKDSASEAS